MLDGERVSTKFDEKRQTQVEVPLSLVWQPEPDFYPRDNNNELS
ncbi:MAG: hypothetical protein V5A57_00320 [Candidatus Paceibacterota bacterium]